MKRCLNIRKSFKFHICSIILYQMLSKWVYSHHCCIQCHKKLHFVYFLVLAIHGYQREVLSINPGIDLPMVGKIGCLVQESLLIKAGSGEHCANSNFVHFVTLRGTCVCLIMYLVVHQMKYVVERSISAIIFCNFLMYGLKSYPRKGNPDLPSHRKLYITWLWL